MKELYPLFYSWNEIFITEEEFHFLIVAIGVHFSEQLYRSWSLSCLAIIYSGPHEKTMVHQCAHVNFRRNLNTLVSIAVSRDDMKRDEAFRPTLRYPAENVSRAVYGSECE